MEELIEATVKFPSDRIYDTDRGPRRKAVFSIPGQEDLVSVWDDASNEELKRLKRKQKVTLLYDGKNFKLAPKTPPTPPSRGEQPSGQPWTPEQKQAIFTDLQQRAALLVGCHLTLQKQLKGKEVEVDSETLAAYTVALYNDLRKP